MENTKVIFCDSSDETELEAYCNSRCEITISISGSPGQSEHDAQVIYLSKQTAIRLVKHLKREIGALIELERGQQNG